MLCSAHVHGVTVPVTSPLLRLIVQAAAALMATRLLLRCNSFQGDGQRELYFESRMIPA